jgi:hypothetical protein
MVDNHRYRAFISYSHDDSKEARWLHRAIETYHPPKTLVGTVTEYGAVPAAMGKVFRDEEELAGAAELGGELEGALAASASLIVICSPKASTSRWVDHEIRYFKQVNPGCPVLAVIAKGQPGDAAGCFPESLLFGVTSDGRIDRNAPIEPLAPDMQKLDHSVVKLKLIAGLLGVGYDDLARRELRREREQRAMIMGGGGGIITVLIGLLVWALISANIAKKAYLAKEAADAKTIEENWLAHDARDSLLNGKFIVVDPAKEKAPPAKP